MKLKIIHYAVILLLVAGTFSSCGEKDDMPQFSFTEFSLADMKLLIYYDEMSEDRVIVINSMQELQQYIECREKPGIDFTTHSMLLIIGVVENILAGAGGSVGQLAEDEYRVNVEVNTRFHPLDPQLWAIAFITSKLSNKSVIRLGKTLNNLDLADCSPTISFSYADCSSCLDIEDTFEIEDLFGNEIYGKWKLIKIYKWLDKCFDYSQCDIVVEFKQSNNVFTISGKNGHIIFDDWTWDRRASYSPATGWIRQISLYPNPGFYPFYYNYRYRLSLSSNELVIDDYYLSFISPFYKNFSYYFIKL